MSVLLGIAAWAIVPGIIAKNKGRSFWGYFFLSFLITPLITIIITLCLSKKNEEAAKPEPAQNNSAPKMVAARNAGELEPMNYVEPQRALEAEPRSYRSARFCRQCGSKLIEGSEFCSYCGTKVIY